MRHFRRFQIGTLEVQPVGDHELDAVAPRHLDHPLAVLRSDRHRLLAENVQAGTRGALRVFTMHRIGQRDVDGVDLATPEELVGIVVAADAAHAVAAGKLPQLFRVIGDQRRQRAILQRLREGRQDRGLRDVSETDDGVSDLLSGDDALGRAGER